MQWAWWYTWYFFLNVVCSATTSGSGCTIDAPCRVMGSCEPDPRQNLTPLETFRCTNRTTLGAITLPPGSGFGSSFQQVLNGIAAALQLDICFFIDERYSHLRHASWKSFWSKYFEPMGIPVPAASMFRGFEHGGWIDGRHPFLQLSAWRKQKGVVELRTPLNPGGFVHRVALQETSLKHVLHGQGLTAKQELVRKVIRYRAWVGNSICSRFSALGLRPDYIAITVRRGDKVLEVRAGHAVAAPISWYVQIIEHLSGEDVPQVFVATDDASSVQELRDYRPRWEILSVSPANETGFVLNELRTLSASNIKEQQLKHFLELHALANARYFVGTQTTTVTKMGQILRRDKADNTTIIVEDFKP